MFCVNPSTGITPKLFDSVPFKSQLNPFPIFNPSPASQPHLLRFSQIPPIQSGLREIRERIASVKNTQKVTEAIKLVAAAKLRRAQEAVINGRPFAETLAEVLLDINEQCRLDDVETPLTAVRPVRRVALIVITSDRGLCGGFNSALLKRADIRISELTGLGLGCTLVSVGKKGNSYFKRRPDVSVDRFVEGENFPTSKEAQVIADIVFSLFLSEEVDKVELLYTKFVSMLKSDPVVRTLLPLSPKGEGARDADGNNVDAYGDEYFRLTTKKGKMAVERDRTSKKVGFLPNYQFEQDPARILDALMPLYLNSQILRALQESYASELAARMNAMYNATENAVELTKNLSMAYNKQRQGKITSEILEIVAGAEAFE
ncbi:hypothetical protein OROGR_007241 [Orobanche gracilis]